MKSDRRRWQPSTLFIVAPRGLFAMVLSSAIGWTLVGGETVTCVGSARDWQCERRSEALFSRLFDGVFENGSLSGPNKRTKTEIFRSNRGRYAAMIHADKVDFRLAEQHSHEAAEADRKAWLRWAHTPAGTLTQGGPSEGRYRVVAWFVTFLTLASLVVTASARLWPPTR